MKKIKKNHFDIELISHGGTQVNTFTFAGRDLIADIKDWDKNLMVITGKQYNISPALTPLRKLDYDILTSITNNLN